MLNTRAKSMKFYDSGHIKTSSKESHGERLMQINSAIWNAYTSCDHPIDIVGIEDVFFNKNVSAAMSTAKVIGVIERKAAVFSLELIVVRPQTVKAAILGTGRGSKDAVRSRVNRVMGVDIKSDHEADAVAVAMAVILEKRRVK